MEHENGDEDGKEREESEGRDGGGDIAKPSRENSKRGMKALQVRGQQFLPSHSVFEMPSTQLLAGPSYARRIWYAVVLDIILSQHPSPSLGRRRFRVLAVTQALLP